MVVSFLAKWCASLSQPSWNSFWCYLHTAFIRLWDSARKAETPLFDWWTADSVLACLFSPSPCLPSLQKNKPLCLGKWLTAGSKQPDADSLRSTNSASAAVMCSVPLWQRDWRLHWLTGWHVARLNDHFTFFSHLSWSYFSFSFFKLLLALLARVNRCQAVCAPNSVK